MEYIYGFGLILLVFLIYSVPLVITIINVINFFRKKKVLEKKVDFATIVLGSLLSVLLFSSWDAKEYTEQIVLSSISFRLYTFMINTDILFQNILQPNGVRI